MPPMRCARSRAWSNPPAHPRARLVPLDQHAGQRERPLREWVKRADADAGLGSSDVLMTEERAELARLRRENKQLRMERAGSMTMREECSMSPSPTRPPTMASPPTTRTRTPSPTPSSADTKANGRPGFPGAAAQRVSSGAQGFGVKRTAVVPGVTLAVLIENATPAVPAAFSVAMVAPTPLELVPEPAQ